MGNYMKSSNINDERFYRERILDGENKIYVGIGSIIENKSSEAIRIGDHTKKYNRLIQFTKNENELLYEFENDIILKLQKEDDNIILDVCSKKDNIHIKKIMNPLIRKHYKKICVYEIDRIYNFIHDESKES